MAKSTGTFMGGKLNLKGSSSTKPKKKTKTSKFGELDKEVAAKSSARAASSSMKYHASDADNGRNLHDDNNNNDEDEDLTAAEKRSRKFKQMREKKEMEQVVRWVNYFLHGVYCFGMQCVVSCLID
jgi:hypothetical protein